MKLGTLHYDKRNEWGVVKLEELSPDIVSLDILKDWIYDLNSEYNKMYREVFPNESSNHNTSDFLN